MKFAPIVLFVYNRPWHTQQMIEALLENAEAEHTSLIVFSDGARNENAKPSVSSVRDYTRNIRGFKSISLIDRATNFGLASSIIDGVNRVCEEYGTAH